MAWRPLKQSASSGGVRSQQSDGDHLPRWLPDAGHNGSQKSR